jgi:hypothetical protein
VPKEGGDATTKRSDPLLACALLGFVVKDRGDLRHVTWPCISAEVRSMSDGASTHLRNSTIRAPMVPARGAVALGWTISSLNGRPLSNVAGSEACAGESLSPGISMHLMSTTRFATVAKNSAPTVRTCLALV